MDWLCWDIGLREQEALWSWTMCFLGWDSGTAGLRRTGILGVRPEVSAGPGEGWPSEELYLIPKAQACRAGSHICTFPGLGPRMQCFDGLFLCSGNVQGSGRIPVSQWGH